MFHFAAAKHQRDPHFIAPIQKFLNRANLRIKIVVANARPKTNFFHLAALGVFPSFFFLLLFLVAILGKIHHFADRGIGQGSHFHQILPSILSRTNGFVKIFDSQLGPVLVNQTNLLGANLMVDARSAGIAGGRPLKRFRVDARFLLKKTEEEDPLCVVERAYTNRTEYLCQWASNQKIYFFVSTGVVSDGSCDFTVAKWTCASGAQGDLG